MEENLRIGQKITKAIKTNFDNIILVLLCLAYVAYGVATIEETGRTLFEIIATGIVSALVGLTIKILRRKKGILVGLRDPKFLTKCNVYGESKVKMDNHIDKLPKYCEAQNKSRLETKRREYCYSNPYTIIDYNAYLEGKYANTKDKDIKKVIKQLKKIKVYNYSPTLFTNAYSNSSKESEILSSNVKDFENKSFGMDFVISLACLFLFGYFTLGKGEIDIANMIWCAFQITFYLVMGQIQYNKSVYFVTETLRDKVEAVINLISEFLIWIEKEEKTNECIVEVEKNGL